jgi:hypothetical protein
MIGSAASLRRCCGSGSSLTIFFLRGLARIDLHSAEGNRREGLRKVKLDPEERIIAASLDEAELEDANQRGAGARIEFMREGHAKATITISRELVEQARALNWTTWELFSQALRLAVPEALELSSPLPRLWQ